MHSPFGINPDIVLWAVRIFTLFQEKSADLSLQAKGAGRRAEPPAEYGNYTILGLLCAGWL